MKKYLSILLLFVTFGAFAQSNQTITIVNNTACTYEFSIEGTHTMGGCTPGFIGHDIVQPQQTNYYKIVELNYSGPYVLGNAVDWLQFQLNAGCGRNTYFEAPCSSMVSSGPTSPPLTITPITLPGGITCSCNQGPITVMVDYLSNGNISVTIN